MPYPTRYPTLDQPTHPSDTTHPKSYSVLLNFLLVFHHRLGTTETAREIFWLHKQGANGCDGSEWLWLEGRRSDDLNAMDEIVIATNQLECMHAWEV